MPGGRDSARGPRRARGDPTLITILSPTTCKLPAATEASIAGAVFRAASGLDARVAEREPQPDPPDLLVAVPGPGDAAVWAELLAADCPALVHLGCELPRIEAWARGLQGERDNRPCPPIWPWTHPQVWGHAMQWWVEARARRPPSGPPWHRVDLYPGTAWAFLWRDPGADPEGATGLAAAQHEASAVVAEWSENKTTQST